MSLQTITLVAAVAGVIGAAGGWTARDVLADRDQARALAEQAAAAQRHAVRVQETSDAAFLQAQARVAAVRRADAAGNGLRIAAQALAAAAPSDHCEATSHALMVCTGLLGVVEEAGRNMALTARERGEAGAACERIADVSTAKE